MDHHFDRSAHLHGFVQMPDEKKQEASLTSRKRATIKKGIDTLKNRKA